jgi:hypothetical protein
MTVRNSVSPTSHWLAPLDAKYRGQPVRSFPIWHGYGHLYPVIARTTSVGFVVQPWAECHNAFGVESNTSTLLVYDAMPARLPAEIDTDRSGP